MSGASFLRALSGDGAATPYAITDVYGLQGVGTSSLLSPIPASGQFVLSTTSTRNAKLVNNSGGGFQAHRQNPTFRLSFSGMFDGAGHIIDGLYCQATGFDVGLFGYSDGTITRSA